ncbi:DUF4190 domain-containing protein [Streptomyces tsukubensis]|uniref:DUF4190 domain-containing protein n=1 Tax=Streptomyces tsukubensis TaxID=83656 RepID=UPI0034510BEE
MTDQQAGDRTGAVPPPPVPPGQPPAGPYGPPVPAAPAGLPGNAYGAWTPQPGQGPYPHPYPYPGVKPLPSLQNGKGTTAMVLGLCALSSFYVYGVPAIVLGILAVIFGVIGIRKAKRGEADNGSQARIGLVTGAIGIALGAAFLVLVAVFWEHLPEDEDQYGESDPYSYSLVRTATD